jgi:hypothetical protein
MKQKLIFINKNPLNKFEETIINTVNDVKNADKVVFIVNNIDILFPLFSLNNLIYIKNMNMNIKILMNVKQKLIIPNILSEENICFIYSIFSRLYKMTKVYLNRRSPK